MFVRFLSRWKRQRQFRRSLRLHGGVALRADQPTLNGRVYPFEIIKPKIDQYFREEVFLGHAYGELGHPRYTDPLYRQLSSERLSHKVIDLYWKHNTLYVWISILQQTPLGAEVFQRFARGDRVGVSIRAWASLQPRKKSWVVKDDLEVIAFDLVWRPSIKDAYLTPWLYETVFPSQSMNI